MFDLIAQTQQVINIVVAICQARFFVRVDIKIFSRPIFQWNFLLDKIHRDHRLWILFNRGENFLQESIWYLNRKQCIIQCVVLEYVSKKAGNNDTKTMIVNGPSRMFPAAATAKVLSSNQNFTGVFRIVKRELCLWTLVVVVAPVAKKIFYKTFACCGLKKTRRNNLIRVDIIDRQRNCRWF